ncbi:hypothetical protein ACFO3U_00775 [Flavobacterium ponti]|uniref:tRNA_anti-like n=1 Tax=Flavobacterium ponti TaxID=665133 RepID=A0ABV9P2L2_9FLAO
MNKKILFGFLIFSAIAISVYLYAYKDHRDIANEKSAHTIKVSELQNEFAINDSLALKKYQDKTIEVNGQITSIDTDNNAIVLDEKIFASFNDSLAKEIVLGKKLKIKGRFLGYDELLEEFKMDQCFLTQ